jgi:uncharacterized protein with NAD-binding domain and iron-sulfur cluster
MPKKKVVVLGGGIAGLSTAYQLSRTPALQARFDVTVYQMGWRLGGKIASGRDATGRNLEHGLHVWFGCYENSFRMLQEVYAARPPGARLKAWTDALKPQTFTPLGVKGNNGWSYWPITWPSNADVPGKGGVKFTFWDLITKIVGMLRQSLEALNLDFPLAIGSADPHFPDIVRDLFGTAAIFDLPLASEGRQLADELSTSVGHSFLDAVKSVHLWAEALGSDPSGEAPEHQDVIVELLRTLNAAFKAGPASTTHVGTSVGMVRDMLDIGQAFIKGLIEDCLQTDQPFAALDQNGLEFRNWLVQHGADRTIVDQSSILRALYDTAFQYIEGDPTRPSYAAGTAIGVLVRLIATYKGDMLWEVQPGMGEAVIAPLYESLVAAGVKFRFFHKVTSLGLSADSSRIDRIEFERQAEMVGGEYRPTFDVDGLECWGSEPDWTQLVNGAQLKAAGVDFEGAWDQHQGTPAPALRDGTDFDAVVLAISMGAYKELNPGAPGMCAELRGASPSFKDFTDKIPLVPTLSLQLWCDVTTSVLGWNMAKPAAVAGPEPLSVWADMSQVLAFEPWPGVASKPRSLHYLCGPFDSQLFKQPPTNATVPAQAAMDLRASVVNWLQTSASAQWHVACNGNSFHWEMLTDPAARVGVARLDAQYMRANISPTECCVGSPAGSTQFRLGPTVPEFANLFIAGEAALSGCNTSSVEGAVMTGMAAARAISGDRLPIPGYAFLVTPPSKFFFQE